MPDWLFSVLVAAFVGMIVAALVAEAVGPRGEAPDQEAAGGDPPASPR